MCVVGFGTAAAIEMLSAIIPVEELKLLAPTGPATVCTTSITIWMLILQRYGKGTTITEVVKDGTMITPSPTSELRKVFSPAVNQHRVTDWSVILTLVAHELQCGAALPSEVGAMYGDGNTSETIQARSLAKRIPT